MSVSHGVYTGPYVQCLTEEVTYAVSRRTCSNQTCKQHDSYVRQEVKFCDQCGSAIQSRDFPSTREKVNAFSLYEEMGEKLCIVPGYSDSSPFREGDHNIKLVGTLPKKIYHIWIANRRLPDQRKWLFSPQREGEQFFQIMPELIASELDFFKSFYKPELDWMQQLYDMVEVHWGLIHYIN